MTLSKISRIEKRPQYAFLFPLAVPDREYSVIEIKVLHAQFQAFKQPQTATVEELHHEIVGMRAMRSGPPCVAEVPA